MKRKQTKIGRAQFYLFYRK